MHLTGFQWLFLILLDFFLRASYFLIVNFLNPLILFIPIFLSALHLGIFFFVSWLAVRPDQSARAANAISALITNAVFVAAFVAIWVSFIKSGRQTVCTGLKPDCDWVDGVIMWRGVWKIAFAAAIMIVINIVPLLIVGAFKSRRNESAASPTG